MKVEKKISSFNVDAIREMSKYGDEQSHDNQSHGDRHLDAQVKIVNIEIPPKKFRV